MQTKVKALLLLIVATFLLSGCMKIESFITFEKGLMTTSVDLYASKKVLALDQEMQDIVGDRSLKDLKPEERARICKLFAEDETSNRGDAKVSSSEKGVDDEDRLICTVKNEAVKPTDVSLPYTVTHDAAAGSYIVKGDITKFLGNDESLDQEQLKNMGAEIAVSFVFPGKLTKYVIDGKEDLPVGVTKQDDKSIRFDLLSTSAKDFTLEGLEVAPAEAPNVSPVLIWILGISGVVLVAGLLFTWLRRRQQPVQ